MKSKKLVSVTLAFLLAAGLVSGCSSAAQNAPQASDAGAQQASAAPAEPAASGEPTPLYFFAPDFSRVVKEDNIVVQEVEKATNTKITMTIVPTAEFTNKFNLLVAASDIPDIMRMQQYSFFQYVNQDCFLELNDLLDEYGQGIKALMPQEAWDLVAYQGKYLCIPSYNYPGKYNLYMRQDWLDNLGLKKPSTTEEFREVMRAFTYDDPDGNGAKDTYGFSTDATFENVRNQTFTAIFGAFGVMPSAYQEKDGKVHCPYLTPEYKEAVEYIRTLYYEDKSIDPDIFIIQADQANMNNVQGRNGSVTGWWSRVVEQYYDRMNMAEVSPEARWTMLDELKGPRGETGMMSNGYVGWTTQIGINCKYPVEAMKLLEYLTSEEGVILSNVGIEGIHYTVNADGSYKERTEEGKKGMDEKWLDVMSQWVMDIDTNQMFYKLNNPQYAEPIDAAKARPLYYDLFEGISTEQSQKYNSDLDKLTAEWFVKFVTGAEPMDKFDQFTEEWKNKGGREVFESYLAEYNARNGTSLVAGNL